jgi:hypothetical protein
VKSAVDNFLRLAMGIRPNQISTFKPRSYSLL